jgi:hypothetical protein
MASGEVLHDSVKLALSRLTKAKDGSLAFATGTKSALVEHIDAIATMNARVESVHALLELWAHLYKREKELKAAEYLFAVIAEVAKSARSRGPGRDDAGLESALIHRMSEAASAFVRRKDSAPTDGKKWWSVSRSADDGEDEDENYKEKDWITAVIGE